MFDIENFIQSFSYTKEYTKNINNQIDLDEQLNKKVKKQLSMQTIFILFALFALYIILFFIALFSINRVPRYVTNSEGKDFDTTLIHYVVIFITLIYPNPFWVIYYIYLIYTRYKK